jgi:hypothetical protein
VGPDGVVPYPPVLQPHPSLEEGRGGLNGEQFIAEPAAEALYTGFCQGEPSSMELGPV